MKSRKMRTDPPALQKAATNEISRAAQPHAEPNALLGIVFLVAFQGLGELLSRLANLPLPGSIIGLVLLLACIKLRGETYPPVNAGARLLLKYLPMFLVPVCVGIMQVLPSTAQNLPKFLLALSLAVTIGVVLTGVITRWLMKTLAPSNDDSAHPV